jgi:Flp pilus assembly protein TadG
MQNRDQVLRRGGTKGVLTRLRTSTSGNVGYMFAAMLFPMIAMVGSGVDLGRAYMTKARLQAACDAGTLAGRRAMTNLTYDSVAQAKAQKMFNFNFVPADYSAEQTSFTATADAQGKITGSAQTKMSTVVMQVFNYNAMDLSVVCGADIQIPNIDTVLVLDVTGSMAQCPSGSNSCNGGAGSKIEGLRTAVGSFYTTLKNATVSNSNTQVRYAFVPYSHTVNGGQLFKQSPDTTKGELSTTNLVDNWTYQSRVANFNEAVSSTPPSGTGSAVAGTPVVTQETFRKSGASTDTPMSFNDCTAYSNNTWFAIDSGPNSGTNWNPTDLSGDPIYLKNGAYTSSPPAAPYSKVEFAKVSSESGWNNANEAQYYRVCTRSKTVTPYTSGPGGTPTTVYKFSNWTYKPVAYDVSNFKTGSTINYVSAIDTNTARVPVAGSYDAVALRALSDQTGFTSSSMTWLGCLEERDTVTNATFSPIPSGARDLDVISAGTSDNMRWRPMLHNLMYRRSGPSQETSTNVNNQPDPNTCPGAPMRNLNTMTQSDINAYLPLLQPVGNTYHDIGMIWAIRLISPNGMFASRNAVGANGGQISRNIIFMTDGELAPNENAYSSYGIESVDERVGGGSDPYSRHAARFQAMCDMARREKISVWVIAFGTTLTSNLTACADGGRAFSATNSAELQSRFTTIASEIADLRLVK